MRPELKWNVRKALVAMTVPAIGMFSCANPPQTGNPDPAPTYEEAASAAHHGATTEVTTGVLEQPLGGHVSSNIVGRAPRRMSIEQFRASLYNVTGFTWTGKLAIPDPNAPGGVSYTDNADMIDYLATTLGRPDYRTSVRQNLDPNVPFTKLTGDAARFACKQAIQWDWQQPNPANRKIVRRIDLKDTLATNPAGVRANIAEMALIFWGRKMDPMDPELDALIKLFDTASTAPPDLYHPEAYPPDGWRAVCIAMATHPLFLMY